MSKFKIPLIAITSHPELLAEIIGQFVFMMMMARPEDPKFKEIQQLDLNTIFAKADMFFIEFTDVNGTIITEWHDLEKRLTQFLTEWKHIVDVTAIQQNIHYRLKILNK